MELLGIIKTMTGEEKIQALIGLVDKAYQSLVRGNIIELHSADMKNTGLNLEEQAQALGVLANEYGCITFTSRKVFESYYDIGPYEMLDIVEIADMAGVSQEGLIEDALAERIYTVTILAAFENIVHKTEKSQQNSAEKEITPESLKAELSFTKISIPNVIVDRKTYIFPTMRDGAPFHIVDYCLRYRVNQQVTINELVSEMKANDITAHGITNIREELRKSIFGEKQPLGVFVDSSPQAILVKSTVELNENQLELIKKTARTYSE